LFSFLLSPAETRTESDKVTGLARRGAIAIGAIGLIGAAVGTMLWTFADPSTTGAPYALYVGGIAFAIMAVLVAGLAPSASQPIAASTWIAAALSTGTSS
jgi:hypothetical protein